MSSTATLHTSLGDIVIELYPNHAPKTVANFVELATGAKEWTDPRDGKKTTAKLYDGTIFHRVISGFMIQGGDPLGTGTGGPGYKIDCELTGGNQYHDRGVLSMAHAGKNTGGSQFFVCHSRRNTSHLDRAHTCFGKVIEGVDVVDDIRQGDAIESITIID